MAVSPTRRSRAFPWWTVLLCVVVLGVGAAFLLLALGNTLTIPWFNGPLVLALGERTEEGPPPGRVGVPISARGLPAYHQLTRDDLWNPQAQRLAVAYLTPEQVERTGALTELRDVIGRVLDHDKPAGYAFTERDFLPKGTRPGLTAGIPPGKRALRIDVSRIDGLVGLNPGDHFDMLSSVPIELDTNMTRDMGGVFGRQLQIQAALGTLREQARVSPLVSNGVVVTPMQTRSVPLAVNTLTQGLVTRTRPVQEIVVAVDSHEVAPLAEALALEMRVLCVPRSGQPGAHDEDPAPSPRAPNWPLWGGVGEGSESSEGGMSLVETIDGSDRVLTPVPRGRDR
ncbi:MAG: hypothetical protein DHS20C15_04060 [Planctomycetota bacterium]|nr:MAG: hypothetical protein DHS20C15_04060 [Planctomycetota bacterium]